MIYACFRDIFITVTWLLLLFYFIPLLVLLIWKCLLLKWKHCCNNCNIIITYSNNSNFQRIFEYCTCKHSHRSKHCSSLALLQKPQSFRYSHHMHWLQLIHTLPVFHFGPCAICDQNSQHGKDRDWFALQCWYFSGLGTEWTGKGQFQHTTRELTISKCFTITKPKKVNSYTEGKNNSYNTEKLL